MPDFFDRLDALEVETPIPDLPQDVVEAAQRFYEAATERVGQIAEVRYELGKFPARSYGAEFLSDNDRKLEEATLETIKGYYRKVTSYIDDNYSTDFQYTTLFSKECSRPDAPGFYAGRDSEAMKEYREWVPTLLNYVEVLERIADYLGPVGVVGAGQGQIAKEFEETYYGSPKIGRTYVDLNGYTLYERGYDGKDKLTYGSGDRLKKLATALWHFEHPDELTAPSFFLRPLTSHLERDTVEPSVKYTLEDHGFLVPAGRLSEDGPYCTRLDAITLYKGGKIRIGFKTPADVRAFAELYKLS